MTNKRIARSVARKYAGLFEAPPKVLEQVYANAKSEFAKSVWEDLSDKQAIYSQLLVKNVPLKDQFEEERQGLHNWIETSSFYEELMESPFEYEARLFSYRGIKEDFYGGDIRAVVSLAVDSQGAYEVTATIYGAVMSIERETYSQKSIQTKQGLKRALDAAEKSTFPIGQALAGMNTNAESLKKLEDLMSVVWKDVDSNTMSYGELRPDLSGWKYVKGKDLSEIESRLPKLTYEILKEDYSPIGQLRGQWNPRQHKLTIVTFPHTAHNVSSYEDELSRLYDTCEHEVIHYAQTILALLKDQPKKTYGLPTKRQPTSYTDFRADFDGYLADDVEYQSWLTNEISRFKRSRSRFEKSLWKQMAIEWTDSGRGRNYYETVNAPSDFFIALKKAKPSLWRKAVKEFMQQYNRP